MADRMFVEPTNFDRHNQSEADVLDSGYVGCSWCSEASYNFLQLLMVTYYVPNLVVFKSPVHHERAIGVDGCVARHSLPQHALLLVEVALPSPCL